MGLVLSGATPLALAAASNLWPTPHFRHYDVIDGLPSSVVYTVVQDRTGYIWVGTKDGLARFDGVEFTVFRHDARNSDSLPSNDVSVVLPAADGSVWVGGEGSGLNQLPPGSRKFRHWMHRDGDAGSLANDDLLALAQTPDGAVWVGTFGSGLDRLDPGSGHFTHMRHDLHDPASLASDVVTDLYVDAAGRLWIGSVGGLDVLDGHGRLHHVSLPGVAPQPAVWDIKPLGDDVLVASTRGVFRVDAALRAEAIGVSKPDSTAFAAVRDSTGALWIGTRHGLSYEKDGQWIDQLAAPRGGSGDLAGFTVLRLLIDREGGLWCALQDGGLDYLAPDWRRFSTFSGAPGSTTGLAGNRILALAPAADGGLWVGGSPGWIDHLDPRTGAIEHIVNGGLLGGSSVAALLEDTQRRLWAGQSEQLVVREHGRIHRVGKQVLPRTAMSRLIAAPGGGIFVAVLGHGLYEVSADTRHVRPVPPASDTSGSLETLQLRWGPDKALWRATGEGLERLTPDAARSSRVQGIVGHSAVASFVFAADGGLWVARPDALEHYAWDGRRARRLKVIGAEDGWPGVPAHGMEFGPRGRLWIASERGLWRYDLRTGKLRGFGVHEGLLNPTFVRGGLLIDAHGNLFAGTQAGVVGFHPPMSSLVPPPPAVTLSRISLRRDGRLVRLNPRAKRLELSWKDRDLIVQARALSYVDPARNRYQFRLRPLDAAWVETDRSQREFTALDAGDYRLDVHASALGGQWGTLATPLQLHIERTPWTTPWAWMLYVLAALMLVWATWRLWFARASQQQRVQMAQHQREIAERASAAKSRFLATLGHEIRTPLTAVLGMAELILGTRLDGVQREYATAIRRSGALLLKLVNEALDLARIEAGKLELARVSFDPAALLREVVNLERGVAQAKGLELQLHVDERVPTRVWGDPLRINQVLLNLCSNAVKFTESGHVRLELAPAEPGLIYRVCDTGSGLPAAEQERLFRRFEQGQDESSSGSGSGLGLAICRELVALMGGSIRLSTGEGGGSVFSVRLPRALPAPPPDEIAGRPPEQAPSRVLRLLLVEDDATVARVLAELLRGLGHQVVWVADALAALAELQAHACDALVLDLDLPGMDGFALARMLRCRADPVARMPILAVTARSEAGDESQAREAGIDGFVRKPVDSTSLARALAAAIRTRDSLLTSDQGDL